MKEKAILCASQGKDLDSDDEELDMHCTLHVNKIGGQQDNDN